MWNRERPERIELEHVMTDRPVPVAPAARPVAPQATPVAGFPSERASAAPSPQASSGNGSTLGATLRFKGDLVADEDLLIQGQVEGSILHTRTLTIGAQGCMHGDIRARRIVLEGSVDGNLYALESVTVRSGATVRGDVFAPRIAIDDGARLSARIDMDNAPTVATVNMRVPGSTEPTACELSDQEVGAVLSGS